MNFISNSEPIPISEHKWEADIVPVISVFSWTYNHAEFIRESIDSILMQKTTFRVEIIIHDDASNDGTAEIIKEYENKYPGLFFNILQKENQWSQGKSVMVPLFEKPRGKYVALTHGDDYWNDPYKLQKQVDLLEKKPYVNVCFTNALIISEDGNFIKNALKYKSDFDFNLNDFLLNMVGKLKPTCSILFKRSALNEREKSIISHPSVFYGDGFLFCALLKTGKGYYLNDITASYRVGQESVTSSVSELERKKKWISTFKTIKQKVFDKSLTALSNKHLSIQYQLLATLYKKQKMYFSFLFFIFKSFVQSPIYFTTHLKDAYYRTLKS